MGGLNGLAYLPHLLDEALLFLVPSRGVDYYDVNTLLTEVLNAFPRELDCVFLFWITKNLYAKRVEKLSELVVSSRSPGVGTDNADFVPPLF